MIKIKTDVVLNTAGDGLWSNKVASVKVTKLDLAYLSDDEEFGELRVFFDRKTWNPTRDGLIYTDRKFERELQAYLNTLGLSGSDVGYSEQGMQGDNYVSCDVGKDFIDSWMKKLTVTV